MSILLRILYWISFGLVVVFWPIAFLKNNPQSYTSLLLPVVLVTSFVLYRQKFKYYHLCFLLLAVINPLLISFPLFFMLFSFSKKGLSYNLIYLLICLIIMFVGYKNFYQHSILNINPLERIELNQKISLIPSRNLARLYYSKVSLYVKKFNDNLFTLLDPNYYFFASHPRELAGKQNLFKYLSLTLIFFILGLLNLRSISHLSWLTKTLFSAVISLSLLSNFDSLILILYLPITLICLHGLKSLSRLKYLNWIFVLLFCLTGALEITKLILHS